MFCQKCGNIIPDDKRFCDYCGEPIPTPINENDDENFNPQPNQLNNFNNQNSDENSYNNPTAILISKKEKKVKAFQIIMFVLISAFVLSTISAFVCSSRAELLPADEFSPSSAYDNEYVTTNIIYALPFYEYYEESNGEKNISTYFCIAINQKGEMFTIRTPYEYYVENLSLYDDLETASIYNYVTVYGNVTKLDSEIVSELKEKDTSGIFESAVENGNISLLTSPKKESNSALPFAVFVGMLMLLSIIIYVKEKSKLKTIKNTYKDYGDFVTISENVKTNHIYEDNIIYASSEYILSKKNNYVLIAVEDVLCMYQYIHKTNFVVDETALVLVNKYGEKINIKYNKNDKDKIKEIILRLQPLCPNAVLGYNSDTLNYVESHKTTRL
ncbi:MAG: zinc ribbon domain-containing protein [Eubacterium sp.]